MGWTEKLASEAWVESLCREGIDIISGPYSLAKREGPGQARRFHPSDYRDLLRIIKLKAQNVGRHSAWRAHIWLFGRDNPIATLRNAFYDEIAGIRRQTTKDFAPRGRLRAERFGVKYQRRVRARPEGQLFPDLVDFIEPLAAMGFGPRFLTEIAPDRKAMAQHLSAITGRSPVTLEPLVNEFVAAIRKNRNISNDFTNVLADLIEAIPDQYQELLNQREFRNDMSALPKTFDRLLGESPSEAAILETIRKATFEQWIGARVSFTLLWSGRMELAIDRLVSTVPDQVKPLVVAFSRFFASQRKMCRQNPWARLWTFAARLHCERVRAIPKSSKSPPG